MAHDGEMGKPVAANKKMPDWKRYSQQVLPHLEEMLARNEPVLASLTEQIVKNVFSGQTLFVFGSGHSSLFALEMYHRAGGPNFLIPVVSEALLPSSGPQLVRVFERTPEAANSLLRRAEPRKGEMLWIASQSGINAAVVDVALEAKRLKMQVVAFTSLEHSKKGTSRHASGKKLFEVADQVVDLGGVHGDAAVALSKDVYAGPLSGITAIFLGHSILVGACAKLEEQGIRCVYTSVNTADGEKRNLDLERKASSRDPLLR